MTIEHEQNDGEGRPCVLLAVDRDAFHQSAAAVAAAVAAALRADVVTVEVGRGGDTAHTMPHTPAATILNAAEDLRPALIVLPSSAPSRLHTLLAGSVTYDVIHQATCPVLLVPIDRGALQSTDDLLTKIVLAVDASTEPKRAVRAIARIAKPGAEVVVLHVHEIDRTEAYAIDDRIESVVAELQAVGFRVGVIKSHALPHAVADDIAEVAREVGAGMLVVGSGNRSLLAILTDGGVSGDVPRQAPCPVLVER
jgi:nucleotide-binding universal stress UspA family protein